MRYFNSRADMMKWVCKPRSLICEIGVHRGVFAEFLYSLMPAVLVLIDPFVGTVPSGDQDGNNVVSVDLEKAYVEMEKRIRPLKNIKLHRGYSQDVLPQYTDYTFDVVYIDGDHSYEGVKRDLELSLRKVKPGGYICGHDYEMNFLKTAHRYDFGVKQAVDEFCKAHGLEITAKGLDGCVSYAIRLPDSLTACKSPTS